MIDDTPIGQALADYQEYLGRIIAENIKDRELNLEGDEYYVGGGTLIASVLVGSVGPPGKGRQTTVRSNGQESRGADSSAAEGGAARGGSDDGRVGPLPASQPTIASNGLTYQSNPKHTPGQLGNRPNAGIEPQNSIQLFERSIPSSRTYGNKEVRYTLDERGNVHRFEGTNGTFHWNGSTGDARNPLSGSQIPNAVQRQLGVRLR